MINKNIRSIMMTKGQLGKQLEKLKKKLEKIEKELDGCRTSSFVDGWQTQRHAQKARKWDILAQEKMKVIQQINDLEEKIKL